jgi:hypothetical protein
MNGRLGRFLTAGIITAGLPLCLMATTASAATASRAGNASPSRTLTGATQARPFCIVDPDGDCLQTIGGTAKAPAGLSIRSGPGTNYGAVGQMPYNSTGTVYCYATNADPNHGIINGDPYWDQIVSSHGTGYVSDYWLYTGGNINQQVDPC